MWSTAFRVVCAATLGYVGWKSYVGSRVYTREALREMSAAHVQHQMEVLNKNLDKAVQDLQK